MAWADAIDGLPGRSQAEIDRIVSDALLDLLQCGYVFFFEAQSFDDEFAPRTELGGLSYADVESAFSHGALHDPGFIGLSFRATAAGRDHFATLADEDSRLFPARDAQTGDPPHRPSRAVGLTD
jgi:hypothetical protein